ncbi:MAG: hypothetical protein JST64_00385 [Actinobacteria bacterium]|nr:hypothetical protein [Actinomycetota bacterium]
MSLIVVIVAALLVTAAWGRGVLADEDRYLRAVAPLSTSPRFARLAGVVVALAARRGRRHRPRVHLSPRAARAAGHLTTLAMRTGPFDRAWTFGHRQVHRHRQPDARVAASMLALAMMGTVVRVARSVRSPAVQVRPLDPPVRHLDRVHGSAHLGGDARSQDPAVRAAAPGGGGRRVGRSSVPDEFDEALPDSVVVTFEP